MADQNGDWTYDDGYTMIEMVSGNTHYAPLVDFHRLHDLFSTGVLKVIHFDDVFGARISIRTDRIESIEEQTNESLNENARANAYAQERMKEKQKPSWLEE
jgi:hypothetical protein